MTLLWFSKAEQDLITAKALLDLTSEHFESIVFHCQQAVEKSLKGYLVFNKSRFQKTHDIAKLIEAIALLNLDLAKKYDQASELTKYAIAHRYPEEIEQVKTLTRQNVSDVYQLSKNLYSDFKKEIKIGSTNV